MTTNSTLIQSVTAEEFSETIRQIIKEELSATQTKETKTSYLTRNEVCNILKISLPTLGVYTRTGVIKGSRIGNRVLYLESDIKEAVKDGTIHKYKRR